MKPFDTESYRLAPSGEGEQAHQWKDKPHRLIYDLCNEIERLQMLLLQQHQPDSLVPPEDIQQMIEDLGVGTIIHSDCAYHVIESRIKDINTRFDLQKLDQSKRPYPDGLAWDEAWHQRQRADALEALLQESIKGKIK